MIKTTDSKLKKGNEPFTYQGAKLDFDVLSFWQWSSSELLGNALRGKLAEFIVASSIDALSSLREEWDEFDVVASSGLKIEVKSSSYLQSWQQNKPSRISFGIQPTGTSQTRGEEKSRKADIYVFCVLAHKDMSSVNPLSLEQWDFYILSTSVLNEKAPEQQTITLSSLLELKPTHVKYERLGAEINKRDNKSVQPTAIAAAD
ncbi:hypothetical protein QWI17_03800 [Gilvimarinus sp. SDUM040013]|uniref:Uncharacterized protein n=1 Tax=Gilvimarinus gilvus TaxID=3058038 RepID=A0ABU4S2D9_9GAMM|nr:hypothetical protein [Gilvimarinus sp. SDUM040013]MDO3384962.1 hypothetical protein [Gilvimarinus sp. SDUM040013]MDX6851242.1 hypothetical protein [Gilvimarinus sp. SDUM040013]